MSLLYTITTDLTITTTLRCVKIQKCPRCLIFYTTFMLNVDWFQPFKLARYSVGMIYLVVMNLPRNERFKIENVILVGVIPGPHEPSGNINTYLSPLVDELLVLWEGWRVGSEIVKGVLLCVASDLPAARKVSTSDLFSLLSLLILLITNYEKSNEERKGILPVWC